MNIIDLILSILLLFGFVRGFFKGFILELSGLLALIAGIYGAIHFSDTIAAMLAGFITWEEQYLSLLAFAVTFILIVVIISLIARIITKVAHIIALGLVNRLLGAVFGLLKMAFLASIFFYFLNQTQTAVISQETTETSILYPPVERLAPTFLPAIIEKVQENEFSDEEKDLYTKKSGRNY